MKFILGTKQNMTTVFTEDGRCHAATIIRVAPSFVTQIKTKATDGYDAVQIGSVIGGKHINKAQLGHVAKAITTANPETEVVALKKFRENRLVLKAGKSTDAVIGSQIDVSIFAVGDKVEVAAISKGKGFQGVVKRHGFHGGPRSHGQKHSEREPGSIGGGGGRAGGRVAKGMRMAGRMGGDKITVKGLKVLQTIPETGELVLSGAVPGRRGTLVEIRG